MISGGFTFISEIVNIDGGELELTDGMIIRKAKPEEIDAFKKGILVDEPLTANYFEMEWSPVDEKGGFSGKPIENPKDWKYSGICFEGTDAILRNMQKVFNLHTFPISSACRLAYLSVDGSIAMRSSISETCENYISSFSRVPEINIDSDWIDEFRTTWSLYNQLDEEFSFINHATDSFDTLKRIPESSDLLIVGYLSIIESIITHAPRLTESLDSINHQFRNKMILLSKRFSNPIDLESFFPVSKGETNSAKREENIWKKLYHYRSNIAHGTKPDFGKELKILKNQQTVRNFLKEVAKQLMVYALEEPQFICDLKKC